MKLRKTAYIINTIKQIVDYDVLGEPIYEIVETEHKLRCNIEPYSSKLAEQSYGVFVDATNRMFCKPNPQIKLNTIVEYLNKRYKVTEMIKYDKHFEVLLQEVGEVDG